MSDQAGNVTRRADGKAIDATDDSAEVAAMPGGWVRLKPLTTLPSAELVDAAAVDRVLVHGSPPGEGRDLDLLARPDSESSVRAALVRAGYRSADRRLVRFRQGTCEQVELFPADWWSLPTAEVAALFDEAVPLPGFNHLVRPSPVHTLLIVARRVVEGVGYLDEKRRRYVEWAVSEDPKVWDHAAERAESWNGGRSLELLERLVGRGFVPATVRARIIDDRLRESGRSTIQAHLETARQLVPRRRQPVVVALSGLDGSGKSTQARLLVDTFDRIGINCAIEWAKLGEDRRLWIVRRWGKRIVSPIVALRRRRLRPTGSGSASSVGIDDSVPAKSDRSVIPDAMRQPSPRDGARELRESSHALSAAWAAIALGSIIWTYRRQVFRYGGRVKVLVYDRYVLDSAVHLRWRYKVDGPAAKVLTNLLVRLAPTPVRSFYLELPSGTAQSRKMEDRLEDLDEHVSLYRQALLGPAGNDVIVLDATLPIEELAAVIAESVWTGLEELERSRRRPLRRLLRVS